MHIISHRQCVCVLILPDKVITEFPSLCYTVWKESRQNFFLPWKPNIEYKWIIVKMLIQTVALTFKSSTHWDKMDFRIFLNLLTYRHKYKSPLTMNFLIGISFPCVVSLDLRNN